MSNSVGRGFHVGLKCAVCPKPATNLFFIPSRRRGEYKDPEKKITWRGYYENKLPGPVFEARKQLYRDTILQPLETMPSLKDRIREMNAKDPILDARVDIGFPSLAAIKQRATPKDRIEWHKKIRGNVDLERQARSRSLKVDLDQVRRDWAAAEGGIHIRDIADHYGIFQHLFDHGYFVPTVPMNVCYDFDNESVNPVYMGNVLEAIEASKLPHVQFESKPEDLWTLVLTNLDGHLLDTNSEYLHWFVGNVKGSDIKNGEVVCDYLQPFPFRGTGYHRLVFVLYKQDKQIDFSAFKKPLPCFSLKQRTFKTFDFYKEYQDVITPAGLAFFQCTWDPSLTHFFHNVLNMREPIFEYKEPEVTHPPQEQYPIRKPFNVYLDRYRDSKEIKKEVLLKRLNNIHPFEEEPPMPEYPNLHYEPPQYSWQNDDQIKERYRIGKFRDLRPHSVYPQEDNLGNYKNFINVKKFKVFKN